MSKVYSYSNDIDVKRDVKYVIIADDPQGAHGNDIAAFKDDIVVNGNVTKSYQGIALVDDINDMDGTNDFTSIPDARLITPLTHEPMMLYAYDTKDTFDTKYTYSTQWMFYADNQKISPFDAAMNDEKVDLFFETDDTHELTDFDNHTPLRHPTYMRFDSYSWDLDRVMDRLGIVLSRNDDGDMCYSMDMPKPGAMSGTMRASISQNDDVERVMAAQINETLEVCYLFEQEDYERLYRNHGSMAIVSPMSTDIAEALCIADCML